MWLFCVDLIEEKVKLLGTNNIVQYQQSFGDEYNFGLTVSHLIYLSWWMLIEWVMELRNEPILTKKLGRIFCSFIDDVLFLI